MVRHTKLFVLSIVLTLALTSCVGSTPVATETSSTKMLTDTAYTMQVFSSWNNVAATDLDTTIAPSHVQVFQSLQPIKGIYSKLSVIKEDLLTPTTSVAFADQNILNTPKITQNYTRMQTMEATIAGERTVIHIYEGQSTALSPQMLFIQTFLVKNGTTGFTITFSVSPSVTDTTPYLNLLQSFQFTNTSQ
ncbi:hypothetical protein COW46_02070 [Candidatus Gracilibacteria bacterium CG17_big_fil_post_rev_8_21_14_2_50_48_13]|nr:MAG: hypothetical protein COW46_02070 [Candidatus Gracilibacteria bacterium CG17_big_fil_post_rev_8_21_14_2_50_48_13]